MKISNEFISSDSFLKASQSSSRGFTLLELIVAMTIISMVVMVLYLAFSMGTRSWDDEFYESQEVRLEAVLRLIQNDLQQAMPYDMNWEKGAISLFAGGPGSLSYVTGNGTGAVSGAGAGLFFSLLYVDDCPETAGECLFLYKSSRPSPEFIRAVDDFKSGSEFQRAYFSPGTEIAEKSIILEKNLSDLVISYSREGFIPFAGTGHQDPDTRMLEDNVLPEEQWTSSQLPGQVRVAFSFEGREYVVHVPVGN